MPFMISPTTTLPHSPGSGTMICCDRGHMKRGGDGMQRMKCRKNEMAPVLTKLLQKKREYLLGLGDLDNYRMWSALVPSVMQGLPSDSLPTSPQSAEGFAVGNRIQGACDEEDEGGSGLTPLMLAATSGNHIVLNELISQNSLDMDARLLIDLHQFGIEKGATALTFAVGIGPRSAVHATVTALLAAGANPNATNANGTTPLMVAAAYQNFQGTHALLTCARKLDLEQGLKSNNVTALGAASFMGTTEIVKALVQAGAERNHIEDGGGSKMTDACSNPNADEEMLALLYQPSNGDRSANINYKMKARSVKFELIDCLCRNAVRVGAASSLTVVGRAHCQGSTSLHFAAKVGNDKLVNWLLRNGAEPSLFIKNKMGCLPIDLAGLFGPHPEVIVGGSSTQKKVTIV